MTYAELREAIETAVPAWIVIVPFVVMVVALAYRAIRERRR